MSRASNPEGRVGALKSTLCTGNVRRVELEFQYASKILELNTATAELSSTKDPLQFA